jgi:hypothetical protein
MDNIEIKLLKDLFKDTETKNIIELLSKDLKEDKMIEELIKISNSKND